MKPFQGIWATFSDPEALLQALRQLREEGFDETMVQSPFPLPVAENRRDHKGNPVAVFGLLGGILGAALALGLIVQTSQIWNLSLSAKPLISIVTLLPVAFELTLFGAVFFIIAGLIVLSLRSRSRRPLPQSHDYLTANRSLMGDRFALLIPCVSDQYEKIGKVLNAFQAEEIHHEN